MRHFFPFFKFIYCTILIFCEKLISMVDVNLTAKLLDSSLNTNKFELPKLQVDLYLSHYILTYRLSINSCMHALLPYFFIF